MRISELLCKLERLMWKEGDVDVFAVHGCGCCDHDVDPEPRYYEANEYDNVFGPEGVYLN